MQSDREREDSVPGGQGAASGTQAGAWALGGSSDQKFFTAGPDSPLTAVFLVMRETRSVAGAEVAWRAGNCPGAGERDRSVFTAGRPEAHITQVSRSHI